MGEPPFSTGELPFHGKAGSQYRAEAVAAHLTIVVQLVETESKNWI